jgi:hypothetical protein
LNGTNPAENRRQQIAHGEVFDLSVAVCGPDHRTLQKAFSISAALVVVVVTLVVVKEIVVDAETCGRWVIGC